MRFTEARGYTAQEAWGALDIGALDDATVRLHWTDAPYVWHVNDGPEVFVVLDGAVDMHYRENGGERVQRLTPGWVCAVEPGDEHLAHPLGEARVLVIERRGSV